MSTRAEASKQEPHIRVTNFDEVNQGLTMEQALSEAERCLQCKRPACMKGCPVEVPITRFVGALREGQIDNALKIIKEKNSLPGVCGRVCPQEHQCEGLCVLGKKGQPIAIGLLERFVADHADKRKATPPRVSSMGIKVAVIGSGPAGLTAAADLGLRGYDVTVFECLHEPGGVLRYGIPEFRLPKSVVDDEVEYIKSLGVQFEMNVAVGQTITLDQLWDEGYQAIFAGTGAGLPYFLGIPGENSAGVYSANEFLTRVNLMKAYRFPEYDTPVRVGGDFCVVGGGNVAMDAARTALRLGADRVSIVYRRSMDEMPARAEEVENAAEEGVIFECLASPVRVLASEKGEVTSLVCQRMALGEPDASGRRTPVPIPDSEFTLSADTVVVAIGQGPNQVLIRNIGAVKLNRRGYIEVVEETGATNVPGFYAGGDIVTGAATVIAAMGAGKRAAKAIDIYLQGKAQADASGLEAAPSHSVRRGSRLE
jgi:glutamate synthase (NADPH/NADH) small chain